MADTDQQLSLDQQSSLEAIAVSVCCAGRAGPFLLCLCLSAIGQLTVCVYGGRGNCQVQGGFEEIVQLVCCMCVGFCTAVKTPSSQELSLWSNKPADLSQPRTCLQQCNAKNQGVDAKLLERGICLPATLTQGAAATVCCQPAVGAAP